MYQYVVRSKNRQYPILQVRLLADPDRRTGLRQDLIRFESRPLQIRPQTVWTHHRPREVPTGNKYRNQLGTMEARNCILGRCHSLLENDR